MKRILITGKDSYVGNSFARYMKSFGERYVINIISTMDGAWEKEDFSGYDVVYNVAGIAHVDTKPNMESLYYKVNRDMAIKIAQKAKLSGVSQFVHMSSMIVYGDMSKVGGKRNITRDTNFSPVNFYGNSKLQADIGIAKLADENFAVVSIRPPLIYSSRALGNFPRLIRVARMFPIFPNIKNEQSMIYIDNLCEFIRLVIEHRESGIFHPQNREYVCTSDMVKTVAKHSGKKIRTTKIFNPILLILSKYMRYVNKAFGSLTYDKSMSNYRDWTYCIVDYEESIRRVCEDYETQKQRE